MGIPEGAEHVTYRIVYSGEHPEMILTLEGDLTYPHQEGKHGALEAAANAAAAYLANRYPDARQSLTRIYRGTLEGDPWPPETVEDLNEER